MTHFNDLTPGEAERLAMLLEEAAEVIQACGKILRHGYESTHPEGTETNRDMLSREIDDLMAVTRLMSASSDIRVSKRADVQANIEMRKRRYTHHQE